jgi:hypothetical protein
MWEFNGLPLHPLVVHAAVIFGPLAALASLAYVGLPKHRDRLRWVMAALAAVALACIVTAYLSGNNFKDSKDFFSEGRIGDRVDTHATWARRLLWTTVPFAGVAFVAAWLHTHTGAVRVALNLLLGIAALAVLVLVALTGDAGARAVWGS